MSAISLYNHQSDAVKLAINPNRGLPVGCIAKFHEPGLGKTKTSVEIFKRACVPRLLVVCPITLINDAWKNECDAQRLSFWTIKEYAKRVEKYPKAMAPQVFAINFEALIQKKTFEFVKKLVSPGGFACVVDESSRMKNSKAITTKALLELQPYFVYTAVCSGTPNPNSEMELWAQCRFVDPNCFHRSFFAFRNTYFHLQRGAQVANGSIMNPKALREMFASGWKYAITPENRAKLMSKISHFAHWVKKEDALDLPEKIDIIRHVALGPKESKHYADMEKHLITEINGEHVVAAVALAKLMKLRQVTSGFLYAPERRAVSIGEDSKLKTLLDLLEEFGNKQIIIWTQFTEEAQQIGKVLPSSFTTLNGDTTDKDEAIDLFKSGAAQYLIAHPRSAGHGLTFVNCDTAIFYSIDYSMEAHSQARDRIHRIGQTKKCTYYYLLAQDTIDEEILAIVQKKKNKQDLFFKRKIKTEEEVLVES